MTEQDKAVARLYVLLDPAFKNKLEDIAIARKRATGHRVTLTDLVKEALEDLVRREGQPASNT